MLLHLVAASCSQLLPPTFFFFSCLLICQLKGEHETQFAANMEEGSLIFSPTLMAEGTIIPQPSGDAQNVKVMVRVRLFNSREIEISARKKDRLLPCVRMRDKTCAIIENSVDEKGFPIEKEREAFDFDECFWSMPLDQAFSTQTYADQKYVYDRSGLLALHAAIAGYNVCIFAYGQTGSGKTYSMLGAPTDPGISPRLVDDIFGSERNQLVKTTVECMFFEIYNEKVRDLFNKKLKVGDYDQPKIRQHPTKGVFVEGLTSKEVTTADQTKSLIERGTKERAMAETKMNAHSSRSHAIFQIRITQQDPIKGTQKTSTINLVDLAGSEKIAQSGATGKVADEAKAINLSLTTLRKVIDVLIDNSKIRNKKNHRLIPFRESVLTYVLSDSLGGNSRTMMIATISPHEANMEDTIGTLRYALRAKAIVCDAHVNEEKSAAMMDAMRDEIMALQEKLRTGAGGGSMSVEIQQQIEERQREVEKMEEQQKILQVEMQEMIVKEREMQEKVKEAEVEKAAMQVVVDSQKKERFAAAFRNAFLIDTEKKKQQETLLLSESLKTRNHELEKQVHYYETELHAKTELFDELRASTEVRIDELTKELSQRDGLLAQLRRQASATGEENRFLKDQNQTLIQRVQTLDAMKVDLEKRVQRQVQELLAANAASDRIQDEKTKLQAAFDDAKKDFDDELNNMRKRKDKYKLLYMEANARTEASRTVIDALHGDRASFLTTIKAQQQVLDEQSSAVKRMASERRDSEDKSRRLEKIVGQKETDVKMMSEALREYQTAATEFIYENHTMQKELERVTRQKQDLAISTERSLTAAPSGIARTNSPMTSTPRGRQEASPIGRSAQSTRSPRPYAARVSTSPIRRPLSASPLSVASPTYRL